MCDKNIEESSKCSEKIFESELYESRTTELKSKAGSPNITSTRVGSPEDSSSLLGLNRKSKELQH